MLSATSQLPLTRRSLLAAAAGATIALQCFADRAFAASVDPAAEAFITGLAAEAVTILDNSNATQKEKEKAFSDLVMANADIDSIGNVALGPHIRRATPQEMTEYHALFRDYSEIFYSTRLSRYSGERLFITGSEPVPGKASQVIVISELRLEEAPAPMPLNWRLAKTGGGYVIIDLQVLGAWLVLEQKSLFSSIINNNGGRFGALLERLRQKVVSGEGPDLPESPDAP